MFKKKDVSVKYSLFSIYDKVACEFGPIYQAINLNVALRDFISLINGMKFKDDYVLYHVGYIDKEMNITPNKFIIGDDQLNPEIVKKMDEWTNLLNIEKEILENAKSKNI